MLIIETAEGTKSIMVQNFTPSALETKSDASNKLTEAKEYTNTKIAVTNSALADKVDKSNIIDNLTTTAIDQPLSANQGKILQDQIANITAIPDSEIIALFSS